jgi:hypothetical protein
MGSLYPSLEEAAVHRPGRQAGIRIGEKKEAPKERYFLLCRSFGPLFARHSDPDLTVGSINCRSCGPPGKCINLRGGAIRTAYLPLDSPSAEYHRIRLPPLMSKRLLADDRQIPGEWRHWAQIWTLIHAALDQKYRYLDCLSAAVAGGGKSQLPGTSFSILHTGGIAGGN